jgi:hypothetical protein
MEQFGCRVLPVDLMVEQTEQVQSAQVIGFGRQYLAIACFGFREAPGPMIGKTPIKRPR